MCREDAHFFQLRVLSLEFLAQSFKFGVPSSEFQVWSFQRRVCRSSSSEFLAQSLQLGVSNTEFLALLAQSLQLGVCSTECRFQFGVSSSKFLTRSFSPKFLAYSLQLRFLADSVQVCSVNMEFLSTHHWLRSFSLELFSNNIILLA